ncbi:DUF1573 domain-containing protein [uncultured Bacteroides sp.]|uniref:DUF1573 domain-containing protein n=1 Tax=uncultured Bacteroides sp. TaxID=162156 RepID=UPI00261DE246|nr:DUF1573 domain-containing protein [uncultured Bacteroides sp.]
MKRILFIISILISVVSAAQAQPKITFEHEIQELGYVLWRNPTTITFNFTNTGNKPLVISNVTSSCGCTEVKWPKKPIAAGDKGVITAVFDAEAIGHFYKEIGVYCNASSMPVYVEFNGEVTADVKNYSFTHPYAFGAIRLDKEEIEFDNVNRGENPEFVINVANNSSKSYTPVLMHLPPYLSAKAAPETLGRGKNGTITVTLDSKKLPKLGITRASVYLARYPGDKVSDENEIPVSVILLPDFSKMTALEKKNPPIIAVSNKNLEFLNLKHNQKKSQEVIITNTGKSDLQIKDMQVFNIALAVNLDKTVLKPGESAKMKITVLAKNLARVKGTPRVLMITNDPNNPAVTIRVKTTLKK